MQLGLFIAHFIWFSPFPSRSSHASLLKTRILSSEVPHTLFPWEPSMISEKCFSNHTLMRTGDNFKTTISVAQPKLSQAETPNDYWGLLQVDSLPLPGPPDSSRAVQVGLVSLAGWPTAPLCAGFQHSPMQPETQMRMRRKMAIISQRLFAFHTHCLESSHLWRQTLYSSFSYDKIKYHLPKVMKWVKGSDTKPDATWVQGKAFLSVLRGKY